MWQALGNTGTRLLSSFGLQPGGTSGEISETTLVRPALGRVGRCGSLYDARSNNLLVGDCIFKTQPTNTQIERKDGMEVKKIINDTLTENFSAFSVDGETQVDILSGKVKLEGSAKFLQERRKSLREYRCTLVIWLTSTHEEANLSERDNIDVDALNCEAATHVVMAVDYGATATLSCHVAVNKDEEKSEFDGKIGITLDKIIKAIVDISPSGGFDYKNESKTSTLDYKFFFLSDVSSSEAPLPLNLEEALTAVASMKKAVKETTSGRGIAQTFYLMPISKARARLRQKAVTTIIFREIGNDAIVRFTGAMQLFSDVKIKADDLLNDIKLSQCCPQKYKDDIDKFITDIGMLEARFKKKFAECLGKVRTKEWNDEDLGALYTYDVFSGQNTTLERDLCAKKHYLESLQSLVDCRKEFYQAFEKEGCTLIRNQRQLVMADSKHPNSNDGTARRASVYTFVLKPTFFESPDSSRDAKNENLFYRLLKHGRQPGDTFRLVDESIIGPYLSDTRSKHSDRTSFVQQISGGVVLQADLLEANERDLPLDLVKRKDSDRMVRSGVDRKGVLNVPCPLSSEIHQCPNKEVKWLCFYCRQRIFVLLDGKSTALKCSCGIYPLHEALFKCGDYRHGISYVRYDENELAKKLEKIGESNEINILVLGETGVGKSTWINSIANYLVYDSLEDAKKKGQTVILIPTSISYTSAKKENKTKRLRPEGETQEDDEENDRSGESATQHAKAHDFIIKDKIIKFIDTPGVGDTRGTEQDKRNFDSILHHISHYKVLHGICLLFRPDTSRLTVPMRYCLNELLKNLEKSAMRNMAFCFTHARGTNYRRGGTMYLLQPELKKISENCDLPRALEISEENSFYFDNECFQHLAVSLQGDAEEIPDKEIENYNESWNQSAEATKKLLQFVQDRPPHQVQDTTAVINARQIIEKLADPLSHVCDTVDFNINTFESNKEELQNSRGREKKLKANLKHIGLTSEIVKLVEPRTVCTHVECISTGNILEGEDKGGALDSTSIKTVKVYNTACHDNCRTRNVVDNQVGHPSLFYCRAFGKKGKLCNRTGCGHDYSVHMHIRYYHKHKQRDFIDPEVKKQLDNATSDSEKLRISQEGLEKTIKEFTQERDVIQEISAKFALFMRKRAILPYNDAMDDFITLKLKDEKAKPKNLQNEDDICRLEKQRRTYQEKKRILEKSLATEDNHEITDLQPENIEKLLDRLYGLKHFGGTIRGQMEFVKSFGRNEPFRHSSMDVEQQKSKWSSMKDNFTSLFRREQRGTVIREVAHIVEGLETPSWVEEGVGSRKSAIEDNSIRGTGTDVDEDTSSPPISTTETLRKRREESDSEKNKSISAQTYQSFEEEQGNQREDASPTEPALQSNTEAPQGQFSVMDTIITTCVILFACIIFFWIQDTYMY